MACLAHEAASSMRGTAWPDPGRPADADSPALTGASVAEVLERITQHLSMAGMRLSAVRRRLDRRPNDQIMLIKAGENLDEAIAELRRLAIASHSHPGSDVPVPGPVQVIPRA